MANGTYGTIKPANITSDDVDIFYHYRPSRNSDSADFAEFKQFESNEVSSCLVECEVGGSILSGMYDLRLPLDKFGNKGIYTIYIKPKEITTTIADVSTLAAYPNIRGIVLNLTGNMNISSDNGSLIGYRVEYLDDNGDLTDEYRIITSNNKCTPITQNFTSSSQKGIRYIFDDNSSLMFCTLTPSVAMSFKSDSLPNIGKTNQKIKLINTKFDPIMLEIEMVDHDIETVSTMLEGKQIRNLEKGLITTFNSDGGIYHQAEYGNIMNATEGINHDFKDTKTNNIDFSEKDKLEKIENAL